MNSAIRILFKLAKVLDVDIKDFFDFKHLNNREELLEEIFEKLETLSINELQKVSGFIKEFV